MLFVKLSPLGILSGLLIMFDGNIGALVEAWDEWEAVDAQLKSYINPKHRGCS